MTNKTTSKPVKGIAHIKIKEQADKKIARPFGKSFPVTYNGKTYLANGLTTGVAETDLIEFADRCQSYYQLSYSFYPGSGDGTKSTDYQLETLQELASLFGSRDLLVFTINDDRDLVKEWLKELTE